MRWDAGSGPPPARRSGPRPTGSGRHSGSGLRPDDSGTAASGRQRVRSAAGSTAPGATGTLSRPEHPDDAAASPRPARRRPWRTLLAALGGIALVLAFPGSGLIGLAVLGPM